jgi:hypothetical protein
MLNSQTYEFARSTNNARHHDISDRDTISNKVLAASQNSVKDVKKSISFLSRTINNFNLVEAVVTNWIEPMNEWVRLRLNWVGQ